MKCRNLPLERRTEYLDFKSKYSKRKELRQTETLVYLSPDKVGSEPFTTSEIIAKCAEVEHHTITRLLRKHKPDFEEFGVYGFEIHKPSGGSVGGRPHMIYHLNEPQATLLLTYLKNTEPVREFKKNLVRQFFLMRAELQKRAIRRAELKPIRRELTDVIRGKTDNPWAYKNFTDLAYRAAIGKTAAQLRKEREASATVVAADYMHADELLAVAKAQNQIAVLLEMGMDYQQVKMMMLARRVVGKIA